MKWRNSNVPWTLIAGLLLLCSVVEGLKGTALVISKLKGKPLPGAAEPVAESRSSEEQPGTAEGESAAPVSLSASGADAATTTTKSLLTGIPQIDYIHDPNLPRELNGYNLTDYPFYDRVPDDIDFKCDGLHDGFYASILHKCQVYHHCLFGTRYDFLCANYTAFDQKTFICHFVSEVDCENSPKYFKRNEALYKEATTTTVATTTTTTTQPPPPPVRRPQAAGQGSGRRRPAYRRRPVYDYYYDDYEDDLDYYEDELPPRRSTTAAPLPALRRRKRPRPHQRPLEDDRRPQRPLEDDRRSQRPLDDDRRSQRPLDDDRRSQRPLDDDRRSQRPLEDDRRPQRPLEEDRRSQRPIEDDRRLPISAPSAPAVPLDQGDTRQEADLRPRPSSSVYDRPRVPPKIRRPVPANERDKYDYTTRKPSSAVSDELVRTKTTAQSTDVDSDYYDYEEDYVPPARNHQQGNSRAKRPDYYPPSAPEDRDIVRRPTMTGAGHPLRRNRPTASGSGRRRPDLSTPYPLPLDDEADDYDESFELEHRRPVRPRNGAKNKQQGASRQEETHRPIPQSTRQDSEYSQPHRPYRGKPSRYNDQEDLADEPVPAPRPAYISTAPGGTSTTSRQIYRKRVQQNQPETDEYLPSRSGASETTGYRQPVGQRKQNPSARQPTYADETSDDDYYDEVSEVTPQDNYRNRHKQTQRGSGPRVQPANPLPSPPPLTKGTDAEEDELIIPPQRSSNGKRPFLPSRGGNPTLPRGLQPLGTKASQQPSKPDPIPLDNTDDRPSKVSQALPTSSFRPRIEDVFEELPPKQSNAPKVANPPTLSEALTSRPLSQSNFKYGGSKIAQLESFEEEHVQSRVPAGNIEYRSKFNEEEEPRIPPSASGNFRNKQLSSNAGDVAIRNPSFNNGKYKPSVPETAPPTSVGLSSVNKKTKMDEISLSNAKTSPPLLSSRDEGNRQQPQFQKPFTSLGSDDFRPIPPSAIGKQPTVIVFRTPVKIPQKPLAVPPRIPDLPAKTNLADIDESEYDVTLNDALHPTLHPTRSISTGIVSFPQQPTLQRVQVFKTKIGSPLPSSLSSSSSRRGAEGYSNDASSSLTGGRGYLTASASQRQVTRTPYTSLSVHSKEPSLVVVETGPRDYLPQQDETVQQARKRRPSSQYNDGAPTRYIQQDQYQRGAAHHETLPLYVADETSYNNERQRQNWRRDPHVEYPTQY